MRWPARVSLLAIALAGCAREQPERPARARLRAARTAHAGARRDAERARAALAEGRAELARLQEGFRHPAPAETPYLFVDIANRRIALYEAGELARVCEASVGSGRLVRGEKRDWKFDTPRGQFSILGKIKDPVWRKPDWAFVEKNEPIPPMDSPLRVEKGTMGPYALDLGDGYKIHGTREEHRIGSPVSHGCIRLETECITDLYERVPKGTPAYMF